MGTMSRITTAPGWARRAYHGANAVPTDPKPGDVDPRNPDMPSGSQGGMGAMPFGLTMSDVLLAGIAIGAIYFIVKKA